MGNQNFGNSATASHSVSSEQALDLMAELVIHTFGMTAEHLPNDEAIQWRAEAWLKLLTRHFFRAETNYVIQVCCRLRGDRRDAIKADEILRVAEKVYGCPVAAWGNPDFDRNPQVWSAKEDDWISLGQALDRLWQATNGDDQRTGTRDEFLAEFEQAKPRLLAMIYGGE
jgi:hypothetical protein